MRFRHNWRRPLALRCWTTSADSKLQRPSPSGGASMPKLRSGMPPASLTTLGCRRVRIARRCLPESRVLASPLPFARRGLCWLQVFGATNLHSSAGWSPTCIRRVRARSIRARTHTNLSTYSPDRGAQEDHASTHGSEHQGYAVAFAPQVLGRYRDVGSTSCAR